MKISKITKIVLSLLLAISIGSYSGIFFDNYVTTVVAATISGDYTYEMNSDSTITIINYGGSEKNLIIPTEIDGYTVTRIGYGAFAECKSIETLTIPNSVVSIGDYSFSQSTQIREINIPDSVASFGRYSFAGCNSLEKIKIPSRIRSLSYGAFFDCISLKEVILPDGLQTIGGTAFGNCRALNKVIFPSSLLSIEGNAFTECVSLESVVLPEGFTTLGSGVFSGCLSLSNIALPSSLVGIGQNAFQECVSLESIVIPENVSGLGYGAFTGCTSLKNVNIPTKITEIGDATFSGCQSLESIVIPDTVTSLGNNVFSGCSNLKEIVLPDSIQSIGAETFTNCTALRSITLPKNLKQLSASLFRYSTNLEQVILPNGMTSIEATAFADCPNLKSVTIPNTVNSLGSRVFSNSPKVVVLIGENSEAYRYAINNSVAYRFISTGINLDKDNLMLKVGNKSTFSVILSPYTVLDNANLTWTSSAPDIVSVSNDGTVTANAVGNATITVRNANGHSATATVHVDDVVVPITSVVLSETTLTMNKETSQGLRVIVNPSDTTMDTTITWKSSNEEIASVSTTGLIRAKRPGKVVISATSSNGIVAECAVTIKSEIKSVVLNQTALTLEEGSNQSLRATINPSDTTDAKDLTWVSSNTSVATINQSGEVTAVAPGTATITVTTVNGRKAECKITVTQAVITKPIISVTLNKTSLTLVEDEEVTLTATINPSDTTDSHTLVWSSSNEDVATVVDGVVTAKSAGTATITATSVNGKQANCVVTVNAKEIPITSVTLNQNVITIKAGKNATLTATISPENTTQAKTLSWTSSDEDVAAVVDGVITAKKTGTATITATTVNGLTATCTVYVYEINKDSLSALITNANALDADDYTATSYQALMTVVSDAQDILTDEDATQDQVDQMVNSLTNALDALVERVSANSYQTLLALIDECEKLAPDFTATEFATMNQLLVDANTLIANGMNEVSDTDATAAINALSAEKANLSVVSAKKELENLIRDAHDLLNGDTTGIDNSNLEVLNNAITKAEKLISDGSNDANQLRQSIAEITVAIENCKVEVNVVVKTHLEQLLEICTNYNTSQFTETSVEVLEQAKDNAIAIIANENATQSEVDDAYEQLISALQGLQVKVEVNKNALGTNLTLAQNILDSASDYKASTISGLDDLVENARNIYKDVNATKKDVDDVNAALRIALMKARKKPN
ncbi:MAG: leucine-rich repeat protein [Erysipelotrichaceae bacterium]|nr:leucine-rich repeat protein [Erysipelotrichaceae bacterium]